MITFNTSVLIGAAPATVVVTTTSLSPDALVGHDGAHHDHPLEVELGQVPDPEIQDLIIFIQGGN